MMGVDPGSTTGIAIVVRGRLVYCKQFKRAVVFDTIINVVRTYNVRDAAVEKPRLGLLYARNRIEGTKDPLAGQIKIAQNVGQNIALTDTICMLLEREGVEVRKVEPGRKRKGTPGTSKWDCGLWARVFDWSARLPGGHARDAAVIAYLNEGKTGGGGGFKSRSADRLPRRSGSCFATPEADPGSAPPTKPKRRAHGSRETVRHM